MTTGNINLTFDAPDLNLTGTGDFNISDYISEMFYKNPSLSTIVESKISDIFNNIDTNIISKNYETKIKTAFKIDSTPLDLGNIFKKQLTETFKKLNLKPEDIIPKGDKGLVSATNTNIKTTENDKIKGLENQFSTFVKDIFKRDLNFPSLYTINQNLVKFLKETVNKNIIPNADTPIDTVFKQTNDVNIVDISSDALKKISHLFGFMGGKDHASVKREEKKGNWVDDLFSGKAFATLAEVLLGKALIDSLIKKMFSKGILARLGSLTGIALLAGGIFMMAMDGIDGWTKSGEWGASKIASTIGGALGGTDDGINNAWRGALKGGLVGGDIGKLVGGPLGLIVGGLLGAAVFGIMGYIGGEKIAEKLDELSDRFATWYNTNLDIFMKESVTKRFLHATGSLSLGEDDVTQAIRKTLFDALIFRPLRNVMPKIGEKLILAGERMLGTQLYEMVLDSGGQLLSREIGRGTMRTVGSNVLKYVGKLFKFIPVLSAIIGLVEAFDYFSQGKYDQGFIAIASGIAYCFTGLGTGVGLMLDLVNVGLSFRKEPAKGNFNQMMTKLPTYLKTLPFIGSLVYISEGFGYLIDGQYALGFSKLFSGLGNLLGLNLLGFDIFTMDTNVENSMNKAYGKGESPIRIGMRAWLKSQPAYIRYMFSLMGADVENLEDLLPKEVAQNSNNKLMEESFKQGILNAKTPTERHDWEMAYEQYKQKNIQTPNTTQTATNTSIPISTQLEEKNKPSWMFSNKWTKSPVIESKAVTQENKPFTPIVNDSSKALVHIDALMDRLTNMTEKLNSTMSEINAINKTHTDIFKNLLRVNVDQLDILPTLTPIPQIVPPSPMPDLNSRDAVFDYRNRVIGYTIK